MGLQKVVFLGVMFFSNFSFAFLGSANFTFSADAEGTLPRRAPKKYSKKLPKEVYGEGVRERNTYCN